MSGNEDYSNHRQDGIREEYNIRLLFSKGTILKLEPREKYSPRTAEYIAFDAAAAYRPNLLIFVSLKRAK